MRRVCWTVRPGAALALALAWFLDERGLVPAALLAAAVHEAGHALALRLGGARVTRVTLGLSGAEMAYAGALTRGGEALAIAAGPAFGALWALLGLTAGGAFLRRSGAASALLTAFNLLPVLPLDGGRLAAALVGEGSARRLSRAASLLLLAGGAAALLRFGAPWLLLSAAWLALCNFCRGD